MTPAKKKMKQIEQITGACRQVGCQLGVWTDRTAKTGAQSVPRRGPDETNGLCSAGKKKLRSCPHFNIMKIETVEVDADA